MELQVNGEAREFDADTMTVEELLDRLDVEAARGVAVAVNESVVTRSDWSSRGLSDGDSVEVIRATQGG